VRTSEARRNSRQHQDTFQALAQNQDGNLNLRRPLIPSRLSIWRAAVAAKVFAQQHAERNDHDNESDQPKAATTTERAGNSTSCNGFGEECGFH
jgi:hypothetical protein